MTRTQKTLRALEIAGALLPVAALALMAAEPAFAQMSGTSVTGKDILTRSCNVVDTISKWLMRITWILGAVGLVLIAISAFLGRFKFAHLFALGGGLFIVGGASMLIRFAAQADNMQEGCTGF